MRRLVLVGKRVKGKKSAVVDLQAYKELKRLRKEKRSREKKLK